MITSENNTITIETPKTLESHKEDLELLINQIINDSDSNIKEILINLENTEILSSDFLGKLMWEKDELRKKGVNLVIFKMSDNIRSTLKKLKLEAYFGIND